MSSIRVALRIRPEVEDASNESSDVAHGNCLDVRDKTVSIRKQKRDGTSEISHQYTFDNVFDEDATQEEVFSNVKDLVDDGLRGFNVTVFAFGMTGSGKTHTISGLETGSGQAGIVPRAVHHVFSNLRCNSEKNKENVSMVFLTFVELYNNTFYDLLASEAISLAAEGATLSSKGRSDAFGSSSGTTGTAGGLKLQDHPGRGMTLIGSPTLRVPVTSAEDTLALIAKGYKYRATASTNLNERSSRSHTVLSLEVLTRERLVGEGGAPEGEPVTKIGKINLVDLAGSERVKVSGATGHTLTEAKQINKALSVLGDVLNALSRRDEGPKQVATFDHVPYRNSKLTMLLKDSLGGNSKTMMIATVRPRGDFYQQTLTSLQYAARARHIKCNPVLNIADATDGNNQEGDSGAMQKTLNEVARLKLQLDLRTTEFNELKGRLEQVEKQKTRAEAQAVKKNAAQGALGEALAVEQRENDVKIAEYKRMIDSLKRTSEAERKELQKAMKHVIHSHEGHLATKEREFVSLEEKLQREVDRAQSLIRDKDDALKGKRQVDMRNRELYQENLDLLQLVERLKMEVASLKRALSEAQDKAAAASMTEGDRDNFVEALQKLTLSRAKHKERADAAEARLQEFANGEEASSAIVKKLTGQLSLLGNKLLSLEEKKEAYKEKTLEQEKLMSAAVVRIKTLENSLQNRSVDEAQTQLLEKKPESTNLVKPEGTKSHTSSALKVHSDATSRLAAGQSISAADLDPSDSSATAIVIETAEATAVEYTKALMMYEEKSKEHIAYKLEVEGKVAHCDKLLSELAEKEKKWADKEGSLTEALREAEQAAKRQESDLADTRKLLEDARAKGDSSVAKYTEVHAKYLDLQDLLRTSQQSQETSQSLLDACQAELEVATKANTDYERRVREMMVATAQTLKEMTSEREMHSSEQRVMEQLNEQLKVTNITLESQLNDARSQLDELTARMQDGDAEVSQDVARQERKEQTVEVVRQTVEVVEQKETSARPPVPPAAATPITDKNRDTPSPNTENQHLKTTISALKQQEMAMFFKLEDKVRDLDAARTKLMQLKKLSQRQESDKLLRRLRGRYGDLDEEEEEAADSESLAMSRAQILAKERKNAAILGKMLNEAKKNAEEASTKVVRTEHRNKELHIRLESCQDLLEKERRTTKDLTDELDELRAQSNEEIARLTELVRRHIEMDQNRRIHEMELDSSLETSGTLSPDKSEADKGNSSPLKSPEKVNVDAVRSMVAIREGKDEDEDEDDLEYHDSYDLAEAPTWAMEADRDD